MPTLISWPARVPRGRTTQQVAISMDWLPTLLAAAGTVPDPAFPSDGINLLPVLTDDTPVVPRKVFWRYKANHQRAVRDGDLKYLKIAENTFLFDLATDPRERANLKARQNIEYVRLEREWSAWNATMMPQVDESTSGSIDAAFMADHYGAKRAGGKPDVQPPRE